MSDNELTPVAVDDLPAEAMSPQQLAIATQNAAITPYNLEQKLRNANALVQFYKRLRPVAMQATQSHDWVMFGDKPYLQEAGVKKVLQLLGASITEPVVTKETVTAEDGRIDYYFTATASISFNGQTMSNVGMSSTKDKFFAERTGGNGKYLLTTDEIDLPSVRKKAVTNLHSRLLQMIFPLNPTKEELEELFKGQKIGGFKYGKGSKGGSVDSSEEKDLRTEIRTILLRVANGDKSEASKLLQSITAFEDFPGYKMVDKVSVKMLKQTYTKARDLETKFFSSGNTNPGVTADDLPE